MEVLRGLICSLSLTFHTLAENVAGIFWISHGREKSGSRQSSGYEEL